MVQLLVKSSEVTHPDPAKDRLKYKVGDVVEVVGDAKMLNIPQPEPFWVVRVSGIAREQALKYMQSEVGADGNVTRRRLYHVSFNSLPPSLRDRLRGDRYLETSWNQIRSFIRNKMTGSTE